MRIMMIKFYIYVCVVLGLSGKTVSLFCSTCKNVDDVEKCQGSVVCGSTQSCFTQTKFISAINMTFYSMGCTDNENCGDIPAYKAMSSGTRDKECYECCGEDNCNTILCDHPESMACTDTTGECAYWNRKFDICNNIHEAKTICRKFCNLCNLVDGNWAKWSAWSDCDVTCGQGQQTRTRTCTDPAPAYRGLDCEGENIDSKTCTRELCPVHGGWTDWSIWGSCPVSCGTGIQKRHRTCTNPSPLRYGEHCFGDSLDVKLCGQELCPGQDGGWSTWETWERCSVTCGEGVRQRSRSCNNPLPDPHGKPCVGNPTNLGPCDNLPCHPQTVAFNAYYVTDCAPGTKQKMIFSKTLFNIGDAYNKATGEFVAPMKGTYMFNVQFCTADGKNMFFDIMVGNISYASSYGYGGGNYECPSVQAVILLKPEDVVFVLWSNSNKKKFLISSWSFVSVGVISQNDYLKNYFSGALIGF